MSGDMLGFGGPNVYPQGSDARGFVFLGAPRFSQTYKSLFETVSNSDKTMLKTGGDNLWDTVRNTVGLSNGKWYWEINVDAAGTNNQIIVGISGPEDSFDKGASFPTTASEYVYYGNNGQKGNNGSFVAFGSSYTTGIVVGVALDMTAGRMWFARNNVWQASGDPATNANPAFTGITGVKFPMQGLFRTGAQLTGKFAASEQTYAAPAGFQPLA